MGGLPFHNSMKLNQIPKFSKLNSTNYWLKTQSTRNSTQVAEAPNGTGVAPIWTNLNLPQLIKAHLI